LDANTDTQNAYDEESISANDALDQLRLEYQANQELFLAQPPLVQRYLETQAANLAEAIIQNPAQLHFSLPDRVILKSAAIGKSEQVNVPNEYREQMIGGVLGRLVHTDLRTSLRQRLLELEQTGNEAVAASAILLRHASGIFMVHHMLPSGRSITYLTPEGEEIPCQPQLGELEPESAITAPTDAIAEDGSIDNGRGELLVPYVEYARRFYLPQWVALNDQGRLLVGSVTEAEADIASMQRYLFILHAAVGLASYMVADDEYQQKRNGMLGQLVNQGRALASYTVDEIIATIKKRAKANDLNRGLSLSLPFFNDQDLVIQNYDFEVIPAGRIMFVPAFVVRAAREQEVKVAQDTRLNPSTKKYLRHNLQKLEIAFLA